MRELLERLEEARKPALKWKKYSDSRKEWYGTVTSVEFVNQFSDKRTHEVAMRITKEADGYTAEMKNSIGPWEAIDGGKSFKTLPEAKKYVVRYLDAISAQSTWHPKRVKR